MPPAFPSRDRNSRTALAAEARLIALAITGASTLCAQVPGEAVESAQGTASDPAMYIREYRVLGSKHLPRIEVEEAVYPYLGPGRTFADVEQARAALEKAYHDKGYKATQVVVPEQTGRGGIVLLQTLEGQVGSLRVKGAKYFLSSRIKARTPSLHEGKVINFNDVTRDMVALNQLKDRSVEPKLTATGEPGVFDIELVVKDTLPLHGSIELNNRNSADTTELRLNASLSYDNLWQRGHGLGASYQMSPQDPSEVEVYSGYYIWRFEKLDWLSLTLSGTKQNSDVSTLGGVTSVGRGEIFSARAIITLPSRDRFSHSLTIGIDYKDLVQASLGILQEEGAAFDLEAPIPIRYYPVSISWDGTWVGDRSTTELSTGVTMHFRGLGTRDVGVEKNRFGADGSFFVFHGDLSHEYEFASGWQVYGRVHGQAADGPLVNSEQFGGGGGDTARGYFEAEALGDNGIFGTLELRTPSLLREKRTSTMEGVAGEPTGNEWRFYVFGDAGTVTIHEALPEQDSSFRFASVGIGSEITLAKHLHGLVELALPLTTITQTQAHNARVNFRLWADF